jgi:hypothetical protein
VTPYVREGLLQYAQQLYALLSRETYREPLLDDQPYLALVWCLLIQLYQRFHRLQERPLLLVSEVVYGAAQARARTPQGPEFLFEVETYPGFFGLQVGKPQRLKCAREVLQYYVVQIPGYPAPFGPTDLRKNLLGPDALGNVILDPNKVGHAPIFVPHGVDAEFVPEQAPVFAVVPEHNGAVPSLVDSSLELPECLLVPVFALQETAIAAQNLLGGVASRSLEGGIYVYDRVVRLVRVGDHDGVGAGGHRPFKQTQFVGTIHRLPSSATPPSTSRPSN